MERLYIGRSSVARLEITHYGVAGYRNTLFEPTANTHVLNMFIFSLDDGASRS